MLNSFFFWLSCFGMSIVLIRTGFSSAFASGDWRFRIDFPVDSSITVGVVFFWMSRFDNGAEFSDVVDDSCSLDDVSSGVFVVLSCSIVFASAWKLIHHLGVLGGGGPPGLFPVGLPVSLLGCFVVPLPFPFTLNFLANPLLYPPWSSGVVGCSTAQWLKKRSGSRTYSISHCGANANPLTLISLGCLPSVWTQAVCGVSVKILPYVIFYFLNFEYFRIFTFVAIRIVFLATCSICFMKFLSTVSWVSLYLMLSLSLSMAIASLYFTHGVCGCLLVDIFASTDWGLEVVLNVVWRRFCPLTMSVGRAWLQLEVAVVLKFSDLNMSVLHFPDLDY